MTRPSFDVSKEPCMPVLRNGTLEHVSLRDALVNAHEYLEIQHELLTVEFGLYRLLIALMGDIFFVEPGIDLNTVYLGELIQKSRFDVARIDTYFAKYANEQDNRFDLFSETRPFLQVAGMKGEEKPIAGLLHPLPSGTNVTHFHHGSENDFAVSPASAVGLLSTIAPFTTQGGRSFPASINDDPPIYTLIHGKNLFLSICFNFLTLDIEGALSVDAPAWRWTRAIGSERTGTGYLESLTWMPRKLKLIPEAGGLCQMSGQYSHLLVRSMNFVAGDKVRVKAEKAKTKRLFDWRDPNVTYKFQKKEDKWLTLRLEEGRSLWRDTAPIAVLKQESRVAMRPAVIDQIVDLSRIGIIQKLQALDLSIYGLRTDQMKILEWRKEHLNLPGPLILLDALFGDEIQGWLEKAESVSFEIRKTIKSLFPRDGKYNKKAFDSKATYSERRYWETLKPIFDDLISKLAMLETNNVNTRQAWRDDWRKAVEREARNAFERAAEDLGVNNHALERVVRARRGLGISLKNVFEPKPVEEKSKLGRKSKRGDQ
jgi:CRISPR system Cascade subunit CasA